MAARLQADVRAGKVNGLQRPPPWTGRRVRTPKRYPFSLIAGGAGLYAVCLAVPVFLRQVNTIVVAGAIVGTAFVLVGLHARWTRSSVLAL
jgi:hypothetical protein